MHPDPIEKRKFCRHPLNKPIEYQTFHTKTADKTATVDISEGGISFLAERPLARGAKVHIRIPVGDQVFKLQAQVAYCNQSSQRSLYRTGVAFLDPESAFRAKLAEEMIRIDEYRKKISKELGRDVSEEEAARKWIEKYAKSFSYLF
jgi:c-di-GMP-binding flagellar brake protein YcgR